MKKYLSDIIDRHEKGLYVCRLPTGYGKSFSVEKVIRDILADASDDRKNYLSDIIKKEFAQIVR